MVGLQPWIIVGGPAAGMKRQREAGCLLLALHAPRTALLLRSRRAWGSRHPYYHFARGLRDRSYGPHWSTRPKLRAALVCATAATGRIGLRDRSYGPRRRLARALVATFTQSLGELPRIRPSSGSSRSAVRFGDSRTRHRFVIEKAVRRLRIAPLGILPGQRLLGLTEHIRGYPLEPFGSQTVAELPGFKLCFPPYDLCRVPSRKCFPSVRKTTILLTRQALIVRKAVARTASRADVSSLHSGAQGP